MDRKWKLGEDLNEKDSLLDGLTFEDIITAVYSNEPIIDAASVKKVVKEILDRQTADLYILLENNMGEIIKRATKGR